MLISCYQINPHLTITHSHFSQFFIVILGFIKFLGPYYMLLITKRRKIGVICGHAVYAITKSEILPIPNSSVQPSVAYSKNENRYVVNSAYKWLFITGLCFNGWFHWIYIDTRSSYAQWILQRTSISATPIVSCIVFKRIYLLTRKGSFLMKQCLFGTSS